MVKTLHNQIVEVLNNDLQLLVDIVERGGRHIVGLRSDGGDCGRVVVLTVL